MNTREIPVAVNVNFDSLGEAFGFPLGFRDHTFFEVYDRMADLADRHGIPLTLFVIGKDLEHPEIFARVREWADRGHEIESHSYRHDIDFGALPPDRVREDLTRAHEIIHHCTGRKPQGFIAPNWSAPRRLASVLIDLGYRYDTSRFPGYLFYPFMLRLAVASLNNRERFVRLLRRSDWLAPFGSHPDPHFIDREGLRRETPGPDRLLRLPLPVPHRFSFPCWHTLAFVFPWNRMKAKIAKLLETRAGFYYLMHPADFAGPEDLDPAFRHSLYRMKVPLEKKLRLAEKVFELIVASGRPLKPLSELASWFEREALKKNAPSRAEDGKKRCASS